MTPTNAKAINAELHAAGVSVAREWNHRHGCTPTSAQIDAALWAAWYRLSEPAADKLWRRMQRRRRAAERRRLGQQAIRS